MRLRETIHSQTLMGSMILKNAMDEKPVPKFLTDPEPDLGETPDGHQDGEIVFYDPFLKKLVTIPPKTRE